MIIDAHNHVWPDHVAAKALGGNIPDMSIVGDGTAAGLAAAQAEAGIDRSVCLAVANTAKQVASANQFVGGLDRSRFIPFGTIHTGLAPDENMDHLRANAVQGVKIHPVFQGIPLDDAQLYDILDVLAGELPVIIHVGDGGGSDGSTCTPAMLRRIVDTFPDLDVIACHLGGYHMMDEAAESVIGTDVFIDTSWPPSIAELETTVVRDIIRRHGVERVVFASDWPTAAPAAEVKAIRELGLDDDETEAILGANLARLLGLSDRTSTERGATT